jgi:hypothetical protein
MISSRPKFLVISGNGQSYVTTECREYDVSTETQQDGSVSLRVDIYESGISLVKVPFSVITEMAKRNGVEL